MDDHPEMIRQQMEETRSNLADKLEVLEGHVADTVQAASTAVSETVEAVKETVENVAETVESVGKSLDLRGQIERNPWIIFGGSVALGFVAARLFGGSRQAAEAPQQEARRSRPHEQKARSGNGNGHHAAESRFTSARTEPQEEGQKSWFWDQLNRVKGLAIGSLLGVVRDVAAQNLPGSLGQRVGEEVDKLTSHLGGEPIHGPVLGNDKQDSPASSTVGSGEIQRNRIG